MSKASMRRLHDLVKDSLQRREVRGRQRKTGIGRAVEAEDHESTANRGRYRVTIARRPPVRNPCNPCQQN